MSSQPSACERLAQSRERLRQALQQESSGSNDTGGQGADNFFGGLLGNLQGAPGAHLVGEVLHAWWRKQPLRVALLLATEAAKVLLQPVARKHPYALVLGAAATGGLVVLLRPWRWISTPALLAGLLPQIMSEAMKHLSAKPRTVVSAGRGLAHPP